MRGKSIVYMRPRQRIGEYCVHSIIAYGGYDATHGRAGRVKDSQTYISGVKVSFSLVENLPESNDNILHPDSEFYYEYTRKSHTLHMETKNRRQARYTNEERDRARAFATTIARLITDGLPSSPWGGGECMNEEVGPSFQ